MIGNTSRQEKQKHVGNLSGQVAVVTGASRGIGRGIALALAEEGATVYVTGRTVESGSSRLPGTVGDTAAEATRRGGKGIAVAVDHGNDAQVAALFAQVSDEQGRLDILVNNAIHLPEDINEPGGFWQKPISHWKMIDIGLRSYFVAAWHAAQLMVPRRSGLIVGISGYVGVTYTLGVVFGTCKSGVDRMARDMAIELKPHEVASVSLWQGFTFTEGNELRLKQYPELAAMVASDAGSSVEFPGRVIAALAEDPHLMARSGGTYIAAELAHEYGVVDVPGRTPRSVRAQRGSPIWGPV